MITDAKFQVGSIYESSDISAVDDVIKFYNPEQKERVLQYFTCISATGGYDMEPHMEHMKKGMEMLEIEYSYCQIPLTESENKELDIDSMEIVFVYSPASELPLLVITSMS